MFLHWCRDSESRSHGEEAASINTAHNKGSHDMRGSFLCEVANQRPRACSQKLRQLCKLMVACWSRHGSASMAICRRLFVLTKVVKPDLQRHV
jgi:hypothetical protein